MTHHHQLVAAECARGVGSDAFVLAKLFVEQERICPAEGGTGFGGVHGCKLMAIVGTNLVDV